MVGDKRIDSTMFNTTVVVFWTRFMGRQTKRFVETVQQNVNLSKGKAVNVIYINNDNFFSGL
jgi:hypothetical protein